MHRAILVLLSALAVAATSAPAAAQVTDEQITAAIDRGVAALLKAQNDKGWWTDNGQLHRWFTWQGGYEAYAMLALAYADVPLSNPKMAKGFEALLEFKMQHTYNAAARIMVISKLLPKCDRELESRARKVMAADVKFLVDTQRKTGGWEYPHEDYYSDKPPGKINQNYWDFSNTQMAVLGLSEAIHAGVEVPQETMLRVQNLYLDWQNDDGGWNYGRPTDEGNRDKPSYGSMTAAAVASLFITRDYLYPGVGCPCRGGRSHGRIPKLDDAIDQGLGWLGTNFRPNANPPRDPKAKGEQWVLYWLYSAERVGLASGIKYFGAHDWYAEGADYLLHEQNSRTGAWGTVYETAYAICFLVKGRAPILYNKLRFEGQWNNHPRDLANLVQVISRRKEQPMQWQVINLDAPVDEWHDAPILYITAESPLELTDAQKQKLRRFTDTGGTILFEASCGNREAERSWQKLCRELWPEFELKAVTNKHPMWTADQPILGRVPIMFGMDDGIRTFMFTTWRDISCAWHTLAVARNQDLFDMGVNLYVYATDKRPLRARLASKRVIERSEYLDAEVKPGPRQTMTVARLKHGGDWYLGRNYHLLDALRSAVAEQAHLSLAAGEPLAATDLARGKVDVAWMTGRKDVTLGADDQAALKAYLADGGMLLAEATMGDPRFDAAFRRLVAQVGLKLRPVPIGDALVTGQLGSASGYNVSDVDFKVSLRAERIGRRHPELYTIELAGRPVGVYSPFDLTYCQTGMDAWGCRGYAAEDARAILTNILLLASTRGAATPPKDMPDAGSQPVEQPQP